MTIEKLTTKEINELQVGKTELYNLPNRAACESAKANLYRWQKMQTPERLFKCSLKDNHILLITRIK